MNPVLPVCFMMAYAVALFCFMLVLCSTRSWPALAVLGASIKPAHSQYKAMWLTQDEIHVYEGVLWEGLFCFQ